MDRIDFRRQPAIWGGVLIVIGTLLLLHRFNVLPFSWWAMVWGGIAVASLVVIVRRVKEKKDGTFWWVMLFGFALYKFVRVTGWMDVPVWYGFPLMLVVAGLAFALMVVARPKSWHLAVPALFLIGAGGAMLLAEMGSVDYESVREVISSYWPVAMITYGGALLLSR
jgi:hypothetical protein